MSTKIKISEQFKEVQDHICQSLEALDKKSTFQEDLWQREGGGGGRTRIITDGNIFEKGGVNFSEVYGPVTEMMKSQLKLDGNEFYATGVSIVLHPKNPFHPIMHMNVRYFEMDNGVYWFGGGIDMTPHYVNKSAAAKFHKGLKDLCDTYHSDFYPEFKTWADNYFFIPHRDETRGVGGIFYDHLKSKDHLEKDDLLRFAIELGHLFPVLYTQQVELCATSEWTDEHETWRNVRRGRYVEFNLVYDRGTQFGLKTAGRIESILMSLPQHASWVYNFQPEKNSPEEETLSLLKKDVDWMAHL